MAANQIGDGSPDGQFLGRSASDLVGFHGASTTAQVALSATAAVSTAAATSGSAIYGFTSAQANGLVALTNALRAALVTKGLAST